ncbi:probable mediator of RNA polymerase II transcription subunit 26a [Andrographis paniculata]|uniref:probable mediator of RNA polymerase II transcription subunit 26a n=1 Tax=Andrographis paniculata TaxID=175694 RepID=UPI0021E8AFA5|nr:probable mediator of RNA polymerase II transcription subunit 26a [Andrographis paniculata]XP_051117726.1 probable mediator of RNA polymerase II transcription subunit 26a [Andrographis paniculata]XP_051117727.1 probable mediator of RNA polymerase II transcription subunit 26a [Andrographis paniculata]
MEELRLGRLSIDDAKALQDEEPEATKIERIARIKAIIENGDEKSDMQMVELLRQLHEMKMTKENLEDTGIGLTIGRLRAPHQTMVVRKLSESIIDEWKKIVDKWMISQSSRIASQPREPTSLGQPRSIVRRK